MGRGKGVERPRKDEEERRGSLLSETEGRKIRSGRHRETEEERQEEEFEFEPPSRVIILSLRYSREVSPLLFDFTFFVCVEAQIEKRSC
jgi:hypothetical protein